MSIRSNVVITMVKTDYDEMVSLAHSTGDNDIMEAVIELPDEIETFVGSDSYGDDVELVRISYVSVKWYDWFADVKFIESFLRSGIPYHFLATHEGGYAPEVRSNLLDKDGGFGSENCPWVEPQILCPR